MSGTLDRGPYGTTRSGERVESLTLARPALRVRIITFGARVTELHVPDRRGRMRDVVLGFSDLSGYESSDAYFGATIGRYANRIAGGRFSLDGRDYRLARNEGEHHLHGGVRGFDRRVWRVAREGPDASEGVTLSLTSPAGEEGYPGTVRASVRYRLPAADELRIDYEATTDEATVVNMTHHSYLNLAGEGSGATGAHRLTIAADRFTPVGEGSIPTGELARVEGTPFDFRRPRPIAVDSQRDHPQIRQVGGYDHNWVLSSDGMRPLAHAATLAEPSSGRTVEVWTTEPGLQFYGGNALDGSALGKSGVPYGRGHGIALEPQHFPDSPNRPAFPSTVLRPGEVLRSATVLRFGTSAPEEG